MMSNKKNHTMFCDIKLYPITEFQLFLFSFCLFFSLEYRAKHEIERQEFMFLLTAGVGLKNKYKNPDPSWLPDKSWDELCRASEIPALKGLRYSKVTLTILN